MNASTQPSQRHFATTRWSLVMQLGAARTTDSRAALIELCLRYWYPVYAYVRKCGYPPAAAQDITRGFLLHVLADFARNGADKANGQFRRYLLEQLSAFVAEETGAAIDDAVVPELAVPPADLEVRNEVDNANVGSPEEAYQRSFALEVLSRAFKRLRGEAEQNGHLRMYESLEPFIAMDPAAGELDAIAGHLQTRPLALIVALKRLRQRFRELTGAELVDTVISAAELAQEQQALHAVLRSRH